MRLLNHTGNPAHEISEQDLVAAAYDVSQVLANQGPITLLRRYRPAAPQIPLVRCVVVRRVEHDSAELLGAILVPLPETGQRLVLDSTLVIDHPDGPVHVRLVEVGELRLDDEGPIQGAVEALLKEPDMAFIVDYGVLLVQPLNTGLLLILHLLGVAIGGWLGGLRLALALGGGLLGRLVVVKRRRRVAQCG